MRKALKTRKTLETHVKVDLNLDGSGKFSINTGLRFLDHMLESLARHGLLDLEIEARGDVDVDDHHTVEDVALALGEALKEALGDKKGIRRMSSAMVPMDDSLAMVALDLSGRPYTVLELGFREMKIGDVSAQNIRHFIESLAVSAAINIHASVRGENDHHMAEALFKALALSLRDAVRVEHGEIPSTKGRI
ncbi:MULTISPECIES: imidazoleglycerol-phosphate dehydratase HisB [Methanothermobacter]|uniref:Imidazoleglycerol-phosphate dehydratase n=1 Tax=Methanothermobacter wolfeii TaxID=145261 RepID=A0A9E7UN45_METWO|nr:MULTISPECIES: imidazoleglycerol-phosphate dehydratase HisB [Methanothermobacter]MDI6701766.1 imidazoleglycerol-phosphate dehydratase HisB [Methanothermobacter wolfeii]MDI6841211.1 imidazoleglycerol-phosphate dehydratase HisB [Methanothermobacter wolfeii]NLM01972.1 imidazoleglycerol-phosphate dehydratase HisB [Methanothermobacter wolfeii]QHN07137.1 imidazoleglycerol-phosphate dehydratase HisB [Methanothermobacter sp. THM-1]UXH31747.1 imidazoleglycerol-phosphate dehydratase HisB [Methanotherm